MPALSFAGRPLPLSVRSAQLLLFLECGLLLLSGVFAFAIGILLGAGNAIPFAGIEVSGAGAAVLGVFYGALGLAALAIAVELGRLVARTRLAAVALQGVLIVLFLARGGFSPSLAISVALCLVIAGLLLTPSAGAALSPAPTSPSGGDR